MVESTEWLPELIVLSGIGQLLLAAVSPLVPVVLQWKRELTRLNPLLRRLFWVYAAYILSFNFAFGLLSAFAPEWLLEGTPLAVAVCALIALYWAARLVIQFAFFRALKPVGIAFRVAESGLVLLFAFLTFTYMTAVYVHWKG